MQYQGLRFDENSFYDDQSTKTFVAYFNRFKIKDL